MAASADVDFFGNTTKIADLRITSVTNYIHAFGNIPTEAGPKPCEPASDLLPLSDLGLLNIVAPNPKIRNGTVRVTVDPSTIDIGFLQLHNFSSLVFPAPLNETSIGDIVMWWTNSSANNKNETIDFLSEVINTCSNTYCRHRNIQIGNPDIVGIGMIVAVVMLLVLAILFSILSFGPVTDIVSRPSRKAHFSFRQAFVGTVDELFSAVYVFAISVMVSTLAHRHGTNSRFDVLMADALSLSCSTTVIMLAATYWAHNRERPHATASVIATVIITVALFATHFHVASKKASPVELACGTGKGLLSVREGDPFDVKIIRFIPFGFASWCLALIGAVFHHPIVHSKRPAKERKIAWWLWKVAESLPCIFGIIGLAVYAGYFFNTWRIMRSTYGKAFTSAEKQWGFGQYLAVFTWWPPIMSFIHLYFAGLKRMLEARLPKGWKVYREHYYHPRYYDGDPNSSVG
ncbi:hypothetical protein V8F20_008920 [Naviculisporaceae sp. PSN 640]